MQHRARDRLSISKAKVAIRRKESYSRMVGTGRVDKCHAILLLQSSAMSIDARLNRTVG